MTYLKILVEAGRLIGLVQTTYKQGWKVYCLLNETFFSDDPLDVGQEL